MALLDGLGLIIYCGCCLFWLLVIAAIVVVVIILVNKDKKKKAQTKAEEGPKVTPPVEKEGEDEEAGDKGTPSEAPEAPKDETPEAKGDEWENDEKK